MEKKLHRMLAEAVVNVVSKVFEEGVVADRAVARVLGDHSKWGKRDRAMVAESIYEIVRWRRRLAVMAGSEDWWDIAGFWWMENGYAKPEWAPWPLIPEMDSKSRQTVIAALPRSVRESIPDAFDELGLAELGERWPAELEALNQPAPVFLRVNPKRGNLASISAELVDAGVQVEALEECPLGLRVLPGKMVPAWLKESGRFEIQDVASQQVAPFCQVEPGMRVVDACAGAGGKTLHLAALMKGQGDLIAMDARERALENLKARAARAAVKVGTFPLTDEVVARHRQQMDRVLVDAPCSGSGTLRRQPDLKYRITAASVEAVRQVQQEVLTRCSPMVKPGGLLIYATCSILTSENEVQARWFSAKHPDFAMDAERRIWPSSSGWDGFYMARWRRTGSAI